MSEKILLINGSPRRENSNSLMLARALVKGMTDVRPMEVTEFCVADADISSCMGCLSCWGKTPGRCVIRDDMDRVHDLILQADYVIAAFPLYFFGVPGKMKMLLDRSIPLTMPYDGKLNGLHVPRYDCLPKKRWAVVSACGYGVTDGIYEALNREISLIFEHGCSRGFCPQGEVLRLKDLEGLMLRYKRRIEQAGAEIVANGVLSHETEKDLAKPFLPQPVFEKIVDAHWSRFEK